jgi:aryl-phospho-beta-D-glucosidase BglC (GH1 family)
MGVKRRLHVSIVLLAALAAIICGARSINAEGMGLSAPGLRIEKGGLDHNGRDGSDPWELWAGGTRLRGANIYQRHVYPELDGLDFMGPGPLGPPYTQQDIDSLASAGANWVQISHPGLFAEQPPYTLDQAAQDSLDTLLSMVGKAGMKATIAFRTGPGRSDFTFYWDGAGDWFDPKYLDDQVWTDRSAQDAWVEMWRYTADRYRGDSTVIGYELMVEPNSNDRLLGIWDPAEFESRYGGSLYDWNQFYPRITEAVRQVDKITPILVGANDYSSASWLPYLRPSGDDRTVYIVHQYEPMAYTHQDADKAVLSYPGVFDADYDNRQDKVDKDWLNAWLSPIDAYKAKTGAPLAISEYGIKRWVPEAASFIRDELDIFEAKGLNYAVWIWDPQWPAWNQQNDDFSLRDGPNPANHSYVPNAIMDLTQRYWALNGLGEIRLDLTLSSISEKEGQIECLLLTNDQDADANVRIIYGFSGGGENTQPLLADARSVTTVILNSVADGRQASLRILADGPLDIKRAAFASY